VHLSSAKLRAAQRVLAALDLNLLGVLVRACSGVGPAHERSEKPNAISQKQLPRALGIDIKTKKSMLRDFSMGAIFRLSSTRGPLPGETGPVSIQLTFYRNPKTRLVRVIWGFGEINV